MNVDKSERPVWPCRRIRRRWIWLALLLLRGGFMPSAIFRRLVIILLVSLALRPASNGQPPGDSSGMAERNAFVFQQVMASDGFFVIRERRPLDLQASVLSKAGEGGSSFGVIGLLAANEGTLRFVVTWPVGPGKRATYVALVSQGKNGQALYANSNYTDGAQGPIAYDFASYGSRLSKPSASQRPSLLKGLELAELGAFTLESGGFTDFWQRVD